MTLKTGNGLFVSTAPDFDPVWHNPCCYGGTRAVVSALSEVLTRPEKLCRTEV